MWARRHLPKSLAAIPIAVALSTPAAADVPDVVASIKPIHALVAGVMQGLGEPTLLIGGAGSPHTYSLRPSEARALQRADVVFWVGENLEAFLAQSLATLASDARLVGLAAAPGVRLLPTRTGGTWDGHHHHEEEAAGHAHEHDEHGEHEREHEHRSSDMHVWLDPHNGKAMADAIAGALAGADPENAQAYRNNAARLREELDRLDRRLDARLAPVADQPFVVFHDGYQYFERRYGLNAIGTISVGPDRRPGARRLREIRAALEATGAACVFAEPQFEPALVATVTEGTPARSGVLDPLGADLEEGPDQYVRLLETLAEALAGCLQADRSG